MNNLPFKNIPNTFFALANIFRKQFRTLEYNPNYSLQNLKNKLLQKKNVLTLTVRKFKLLSPTIALANNVFPVPGAPYNKIPDCNFRGHLLKISEN